jgi:hypothetical protein
MITTDMIALYTIKQLKYSQYPSSDMPHPSAAQWPGAKIISDGRHKIQLPLRQQTPV